MDYDLLTVQQSSYICIRSIQKSLSKTFLYYFVTFIFQDYIVVIYFLFV